MTEQELRAMSLPDFVAWRYKSVPVQERERHVKVLIDKRRVHFHTSVREMLSPREQQRFEDIVLNESLWKLRVFLLLRDTSMQELFEHSEYQVKMEALRDTA